MRLSNQKRSDYAGPLRDTIRSHTKRIVYKG